MIDIEKMLSDMAAAYPGGGCVGVKLAFGRRRSAGSLTLVVGLTFVRKIIERHGGQI